MVVLGVVLVVPFVFDHEFQLGILAGMDHREQPQPPLEQEHILIRPGPAAFFQVGGGPGGKPSLAVQIPVVPMDFHPGGFPLFFPAGGICPGRVYRGSFARRNRESQKKYESKPERESHDSHLLSVVSFIITDAWAGSKERRADQVGFLMLKPPDHSGAPGLRPLRLYLTT